MGKKRLEWFKRGICIAMAGAVLLSSDAMAYAAAGQPNQAVEAEDLLTGTPPEDTGTAGDTELPEDTETIMLRGVVSRKKQLVPTLVGALQQ